MAAFTPVHGAVHAASLGLEVEDRHPIMISPQTSNLSHPLPPALAPRGTGAVTHPGRVLIAAPNPSVRHTVAAAVQAAWPRSHIVTARTENDAMRLLWRDAPDVVVLDPCQTFRGPDLCRRVRECSPVGLILLGESSDTLDKVHALRSGADDYLAKPYDTTELLARLGAVCRRVAAGRTGQHHAPEPPLIAGDLRIDFTTREVRRRGAVMPLTDTEFRLLAALARAAGTVLPRDVLMERVWGPGYVADTPYLKVFVRRLRVKLSDDASRPTYIGTAWGRGYRFLPAPSPGGAAPA